VQDIQEVGAANNALDVAMALARLAADTRCRDVVLLDVRRRSPVAKFFLIATGISPRQMRTAGEALAARGKASGFKAWRSNGYDTAKWILIDFVEIVAHLFDETSRQFYDLELLWGDCPRIDWHETPGEAPVAQAAAPSATAQGAGTEAAVVRPADRDRSMDEADQWEAQIVAADENVEELAEAQMMWNERIPTEENLPAESAVMEVEISASAPAEESPARPRRKRSTTKPRAKKAVARNPGHPKGAISSVLRSKQRKRITKPTGAAP
jgi:ribosome-associated protein